MTSPLASQLLLAALALAKDGFRVFPCIPRTKDPLTAHGFHDATCDEAQIRAWWRKWPRANIGLRPGPKYLVLDIDGPEGEQTARELGIAELDTVQVLTGRGRHLYFLHPGGEIGNAALGPNIDVRADKGYVMAPPSVHPDGRIYAWLGEL